MSTITQLICHNFGGIRQKNAVFSEELITAQDLQNIELYYTGINNGVGIRTVKGNSSVNNELEGVKHIVEIFESTQKSLKYFFVYAEDAEEGAFYNFNQYTKELELLIDGLTVTGNAQGLDCAQGWSDLFFFTNGVEMFTVEKGAVKILHAFVKNDVIMYADKATLPTQLYTYDGTSYSFYSGSDWVIVDGNVQYNGSNAEYTAESNVLLSDAVFVMDPKDRDGRNVIGLGCAIFAGRLWIFNKNILWYSVQENIYDFSTADSEWETSAGYIETLKNITAIHPYLGALAVFFSDSSELITVTDGAFTQSDESPAGCAGVNSLVFHDTNLYFYDNTKKAVFSFKQIINGQKTLGENVAIDIQDLLAEIDETKLEKIKALSVFMEGRNEIWWIIPTNSTYSVTEIIDGEKVGVEKDASIILIFDYLKGEWTKRKSQKINCIRIYDNSLYSGADDGNILEEYNSNTFNGDYIQHYYNVSPCNLGAMNTLKVFVFPPRVSFDMPYTNQFYVKYVKNFNNFKRPKIKLIKSKIKNYLFWDKGFWDVDYWANKNISVIGKFPNATFKILEISLYTTQSSENFAIKNIEFSKIKVKQI